MSRATTKFGDYAVHIEWQHHKSGTYQFKMVKKDRKKVGELRKTDCKYEFVIERRAEELAFGRDAWAIPKSLMSVVRCLGAPDITIKVSNGDIYRSTYANFDAKKYNIPDSPKTISLCFVKFEDFKYEKGEPESISDMMRVGKWK